MQVRVLTLKPVLDNREYSLLVPSTSDPVKGGPSLWREFFPSAEAIKDPSLPFVEPFGSRWRRVYVRSQADPASNDFPAIGGHVPAFSRPACDALSDLLRDHGELLDLDSDQGPDYYKAYHVTRVIDALDEANSQIVWHATDRLRLRRGLPRELRTAEAITGFCFHPERLGDAVIFRIPQLSHHIFVTERFTTAVRESGLLGFCFAEVWRADELS
jgi:hypothetical protein